MCGRDAASTGLTFLAWRRRIITDSIVMIRISAMAAPTASPSAKALGRQPLLEVQLVTRDVIGPDLPIAVVAKPEPLVHRPKAQPIGLAIEAEETPAQRSGVPSRPRQQRGRDALTRECSTDRKSMDERRIVFEHVGPELRVGQLKLDGSGR